MKKLLLIFVVFINSLAQAGDISPLCGIWEAKRTKPQKYTDVIYIYEVCGTRVSGYTYDHDAKGGFCLYRFSGKYDYDKKKLRADCTEEIKIRNHVPTFYDLDFKKGFGKKLSGKKAIRKTSLAWTKTNIHYKKKKEIKDFTNYTGGRYLKKALEHKYGCGCVDEDEEEEEIEEIAEDERVKNRYNKDIKTVETSVTSIKVKLKDGNKVDGDKVSIFLNGKKIYSGVEVKRFNKTLKFDLPPGRRVHEITFVADNLGGVPPNTADIKVIAGKATYNLSMNCDLNTNNVIKIKN